MKKQKGLTLLELLITLMIIVVISLTAMPIYQNYKLRANRVEARNVLQEAAEKLNKVYLVNKRYNAIGTYEYDSDKKDTTFVSTKAINDAWLEEHSLHRAPKAGPVNYTIKFALDNPKEQEYELVAEAVGRQAKDKCKKITLNSRGIRGGTIPTECWR